MPNAQDWLDAVRHSHDRFRALVEPLSATEVEQPSYASEWSIADTASHLGSQAEIFGLFLEAGTAGAAAPGGEVFGPIWDRWNALPPAEQVSQSVAANETLVSALEDVDEAGRAAFALPAFGRELDFSGLLGMRLAEHALHTFDVAVALDPAATVADDAVALLVDQLPQTAGRAGHVVPGVGQLTLVTTAPERDFMLAVHEDAVTLTPAGAAGPDPLTLPAEALVRLVYGRLDPEHVPAGVDEERVATLRPVFPGF